MKNPDLTIMAARYEKRLAGMIAGLADQIITSARRRLARNSKSRDGQSALAASLRREAIPDGGMRVLTDKSYAKYVEFGTRNQPARPFLTPAAQEVKVTFSASISEFMDQERNQT